MSTRCLIAIELEGKTFLSVYCHYDGYDYDQGVGPTLRTYHNSEEQARWLVGLGDLAYLEAAKACAYHRDRGKDWEKTRPVISNSKNDLISLAKTNWASYLYIFEDGSWQSLKI